MPILDWHGEGMWTAFFLYDSLILEGTLTTETKSSLS